MNRINISFIILIIFFTFIIYVTSISNIYEQKELHQILMESLSLIQN